MNATKRKFNSLLQGLGSRSPASSPRPSSEQEDATRASLDNNGDGLSNSNSHSHLSLSSSPSFSRTTAVSPRGPTITAVGAAATSSSSSSSAPFDSDPGKRRRLGVLASTTGNSTSTSTLKASSSVTLLNKGRWATTTTATTTTTTARGPDAPEPKFCPGDRDQLIRRLATFQELTEWTPKPDKVNEIEWAKRGWACQGKERVRCTLCNKELVVQTNTKKDGDGKEGGGSPVSISVAVNSEVQEALINRFAELIVEGHQEDCLWRRRACDDTLLRLPLANPQDALASLRERYDDLSTRPSFLPYLFNLRLPDHLDLQAVKSQLPADFFSRPPPPPLPTGSANTNATTPNDVALALALTGWQGLTNPRIGPVPNSASCATCLRRLGLWMFKSKEVDEASGQVIVPAPMDHLDPVREHRFFCPWRNPAAQRNPASKSKEAIAGWEVLAQTLRNTAYLRAQSEKSNNSRPRPLHRPTASTPVTPSKGLSAAADREGGGESMAAAAASTPEAADDEEDPAAREAKDKERWARLRRVKSLFDTKNSKKLRRTLSRPSSIAPSSRPTTAHGAEGAAPAAVNPTNSVGGVAAGAASPA